MARFFHVPEAKVLRISFQYLATYKVLALSLNFAPWLVLVIMARS